MKILIRGGRVIDPKNRVDAILDVYINGSTVEKLDKNIPAAGNNVQVINAEGCVVAPGLIDVHTHLREPGYEYKETIRTGTMAAAKGGFTTVVPMANTSPVNDNKSVTDYIIEKAGIVALSDDGKSVKNAELFRKALEYTKRFILPIISHCEDSDLAAGFVNEGLASLLSGLDATPSVAEEVIVRRDIALARFAGASIHLTHISAKESIEAIYQGKKRYRRITADTCPHYFTLSDEAVLGFDTHTKVNPPLRSKEDVEAVKEGLRNNSIDIIATDHAPHDQTSMDVEYNLATFGISGMETALALSLGLVREGVLKLSDLIAKMTELPAKLLGLPYGQLTPGSAADLIVFSPEAAWTVDRNQFISKGKNTPFHGRTVIGKNLLTIVDGKIVYREDSFNV